MSKEMKTLSIGKNIYEIVDEKARSEIKENLIKYTTDISLNADEVTITKDILTLGAGWSGNNTDGFAHASGSVEPLSFAINANDGEKFIIEYNTSVTGDYILLKLGNAENIESVYPTSPYNGTTTIQWGLVCSGDNGVLQFIPTSNFNGTITNIKIYKITENGEKEITVDLDNVGIGQLPNHIAGFYNFYLSPTSMQKSVNSTRNVAIGYASLRDIVSGGRNIGLGTFSLASLVYGENNIAIGADAGLNLPLAENIVAIGKGAAAFGNKRTDDIAIGRYALSGSSGTENTSKNVAIGVEAGRECQSSGNVFIGTSAGAKATTSSNNVVIGNGAGNKITTGWGNTFVGAAANANGNYSRVTVVGQGATATKHNQAVFGGDNVVETVLKGNVVVRGTDGIEREVAFKEDITLGGNSTLTLKSKTLNIADGVGIVYANTTMNGDIDFLVDFDRVNDIDISKIIMVGLSVTYDGEEYSQVDFKIMSLIEPFDHPKIYAYPQVSLAYNNYIVAQVMGNGELMGSMCASIMNNDGKLTAFTIYYWEVV